MALRFAALVGAVFATGIASYVAQGKGFDYHLAMAFVALVATLALGLGPLTDAALATPRTTSARVALAALLIPVLGTALKVAHAFDSPAGWLLLGRISMADYLGAYPAGDGLSVAEASALAERLRTRVTEGGTILVWGRANVINYLAERPQPTRFHHNLLIMRARPPVSTADAWNRSFLEELERRPPDAAAVNRHQLWSSEEPPSAGTLFLREFLATRYVVVERVGRMLVCEPRRDEHRPAEERPGTREPCG